MSQTEMEAGTVHLRSSRDRGVRGLGTLVSILLILGVFGLFAGGVVLLRTRSKPPETAEQVRAKERLASLAEVRAREQKFLGATEPAWGDKAKGTVVLPVERAMDVFVKESAGRQPMKTSVSAVPPPPAPPSPNADASAATTAPAATPPPVPTAPVSAPASGSPESVTPIDPVPATTPTSRPAALTPDQP